MKLNDVMNGSIQNAAATALRFAASGIVFFVEYVPVDEESEEMVLAAEQQEELEAANSPLPAYYL